MAPSSCGMGSPPSPTPATPVSFGQRSRRSVARIAPAARLPPAWPRQPLGVRTGTGRSAPFERPLVSFDGGMERFDEPNLDGEEPGSPTVRPRQCDQRQPARRNQLASPEETQAVGARRESARRGCQRAPISRVSEHLDPSGEREPAGRAAEPDTRRCERGILLLQRRTRVKPSSKAASRACRERYRLQSEGMTVRTACREHPDAGNHHGGGDDTGAQ